MAQTGGMKKWVGIWQGWSARFAVLQQREKFLVIGATLFALGFGGYSLWIEPAQMQQSRLTKSIAQQQQEQEQLQLQLKTLVAQDNDPDSANRTALAMLDRQLAEAKRDIQGFDQALVSPREAPALLQTLLARHRGLTLVSLATLPPQPLVAAPPKEEAKADGKTDGKTDGNALQTATQTATQTAEQKIAQDATNAADNLFKHGITLKIAGGYHELLAYVSELESGPQKLLWGGMSLSSEYPVSELTLTVYTLSLEPTWLRV